MMGCFDYLLGLKVLPAKNQTVASITMAGSIWSFIDLPVGNGTSITHGEQATQDQPDEWLVFGMGGPAFIRLVGLPGTWRCESLCRYVP